MLWFFIYRLHYCYDSLLTPTQSGWHTATILEGEIFQRELVVTISKICWAFGGLLKYLYISETKKYKERKRATKHPSKSFRSCFLLSSVFCKVALRSCQLYLLLLVHIVVNYFCFSSSNFAFFRLPFFQTSSRYTTYLAKFENHNNLETFSQD